MCRCYGGDACSREKFLGASQCLTNTRSNGSCVIGANGEDDRESTAIRLAAFVHIIATRAPVSV